MSGIFRLLRGLFGGSGSASSHRYDEIHATIGQDIQLQDDWKTPPYAIAVLGRPETVDENTVRIPARITCLIPRWTAEFHQLALAMLNIEDEPSESWTTTDGDVSDFIDVTLIKGGSHDGSLYFRPEDAEQPVQIPQFDRLTFLDGTEEIIEVDLNQESPQAPQVRFDNGSIGTIWNDPQAPRC